MTKKLNKMPYAQAHIVFNENGDISLVSYVTEVAHIHNGYLTIHGLYSLTTRKHIGAFMQEIVGLTYQDAKRAYENHESIKVRVVR